MAMSSSHSSGSEAIAMALGALKIELPSWAFADTGTRFGKFLQPAAKTIEEKFSDAGQVNQFTGACPTSRPPPGKHTAGK